MKNPVNRYGEGKPRRIVRSDEDRPRRDVLAGQETVEIDERESPRHRLTEADVLVMHGVGATI